MKDWKENMTKEERLRDEQEELFFKKMFAAFDKVDAPKYEALNEQLKNDPAYQTTEEEDKAMLEFIAREIARRDEERAQKDQNQQVSTKTPRKKTCKSIRAFFRTAAVIAAILLFVSVTAWASIPDFRTMALNVLLKVSGDATRVEITDRSERSDREETLDEDVIVLLGYHFPGVPEGFEIEDTRTGSNQAWIRYTSDDGKFIKYQIYSGVERDVAHDTEDANAKDVFVKEHAGILSKKGDVVSISWYEEENRAYFIVFAKGFTTKFVSDLANEVSKVE